MSIKSIAGLIDGISESGAVRFTLLYLRSRQAIRAMLFLAAIGGGASLWLAWNSTGAITLLMLPILAPLAAASVIGVSTGSPFGESETAASRLLGTWRFAHLVGLLVFGSLVVALAVSGWAVPDVVQGVVRNLAGFAGLSLITAWLLGSAISWSIPFAYAIFVLLTPWPDVVPIWAWPLSAGNDLAASLAASALLLAGLCYHPARNPRQHA